MSNILLGTVGDKFYIILKGTVGVITQNPKAKGKKEREDDKFRRDKDGDDDEPSMIEVAQLG
jgi:hypothetical protein